MNREKAWKTRCNYEDKFSNLKRLGRVEIRQNIWSVKFNGTRSTKVGEITLDGQFIQGSDFYRYLRAIIQKDWELDGDVAHRIKGLKWKSASRFNVILACQKV